MVFGQRNWKPITVFAEKPLLLKKFLVISFLQCNVNRHIFICFGEYGLLLYRIYPHLFSRILDDDNVINTLEVLKSEAAEVGKKVDETGMSY